MPSEADVAKRELVKGNEENEATRQHLPGDNTPESRMKIFVFQVKVLSMSVAISVQVKRHAL